MKTIGEQGKVLKLKKIYKEIYVKNIHAGKIGKRSAPTKQQSHDNLRLKSKYLEN